MWRNYVTVGVRALIKNRTYAVINILGLAIGLAACLLILLYVRDQTSYDRFVPDAGRMFQLQSIQTDEQTGDVQRIQMAPYPLGAAVARNFPQVERAAFAANSGPVVLVRGQPRSLSITLVERDFFRLFDVPFLHGDGSAALADPDSVAVSERTAQSVFGTTDAFDRRLTVVAGGEKKDYRVAAVFKELPKTSHQAFGIVRVMTPKDFHDTAAEQWGNFNGYYYLKLRAGADPKALEAQLDGFARKTAPRQMVGGVNRGDLDTVDFKLTALPDIYLSGATASPAGREGDRTTILTFAVLALLILAMACVNFTNLATARASQRAREVSLRKVLGATRAQLIVQFLTESVIIAGIATLIALAIVELALPALRNYLDAELALHYLGRDGILLPALLLTLVVGLASGAYPALVLTRFRPAQVLKANRSSVEAQGSGLLRSALVVSQFAISIGLIICTAVVFLEIRYLRDQDPGFRRAGILQIENVSRKDVEPVADALQREIERVPGVTATARTNIGVDTSSRSNNYVLMPGQTKPLTLGTYSVGYNYPETMGMKLIAGRSFSREHALDDGTLPIFDTDNAIEQALVRRGVNVMVNESSAHQMGFRDARDALGKSIRIRLVSPENGMVPATIVGVVGDTRFRSAHEPVEDMILYNNSEWQPYLEVRIDSRQPLAVRDRIEAIWKRFAPRIPFEADFADERAARLYRADQAMGQIFGAFALLAVIVGCLGLFGLAAFTAERRTKEIGIRKVLGARTRDIVRLLVWQFSRPVLIANLIAWPAAWWAMRTWLNGFDARVALTPLPFVVAGGLALLIAVATIGSHAWRVAQATPIRALRYE